METTRVKEIREAIIGLKDELEVRKADKVRDAFLNLIQLILELTEPTDEINKLREELERKSKAFDQLGESLIAVNNDRDSLKQLNSELMKGIQKIADWNDPDAPRWSDKANAMFYQGIAESLLSKSSDGYTKAKD